MEKRKITTDLLNKDIRDSNVKEEFEKIFDFKLEDFLSDYEYDEIDEYPIEVTNQGMLIGFIAETIKVPPQIEYVDIDVINYPTNSSFISKEIFIEKNFPKVIDIKKDFDPHVEVIAFYDLNNSDKISRIVLIENDLRYELIFNNTNKVIRVRVCKADNDNQSNINMRTYYPFP